MKRHFPTTGLVFLALFLAFNGTVLAQQGRREPHIGYAYPAGGQQGTTVHVAVGGQFLRGTTSALLSGQGITATIAGYVGPYRPLNKPEQDELRRRIEARKAGKPIDTSQDRVSSGPSTQKAAKPGGKKEIDHQLLLDVVKMNLQEVAQVEKMLGREMRKQQQNSQIGETVVLKLSIDKAAPAGKRELRLLCQAGLTNPIFVEVSDLPELLESEPNDDASLGTPIPSTPVLLNGQIMPGDVDRFRFQATKGQRLTVAAHARSLMPYLADAVPGWFQATVALVDSTGREVAFADDYRFDPDPVLFYRIDKDGEYRLEIRDALFRGRDDFVYRVSLGELPFITGLYPLGGQIGKPLNSWVSGWNLQCKTVLFDTRPGSGFIRQIPCQLGPYLSNAVTYAVDHQPQVHESEPNNDVSVPQAVTLPTLLNGYIAAPGDIDYYMFTGRAGERIVAETVARRLNSPLDSLLRIVDATGRILASNDDFEDKGSGMLTHHADSLVSTTLPADGKYLVQVSDTQLHGGPAFAYRLRIAPPKPDFELRVAPSSINIPPGRTTSFWVHVLRRDGFDGEINVALYQGAKDFTLGGGRIPPGRDRVRMTLTALPAVTGPTALSLVGTAQVGDQTITHAVVPAENMMQAFAYQHLVPTELLMAMPMGAQRKVPPIQVETRGPVSIPLGGTVQVQVHTPARQVPRQFDLELNEPPAGILLQKVDSMPGGFALTLKADATSATVGYADNLIIEAFARGGGSPNARGGAKQASQRLLLGSLPAIPIQIVRK